MTTTSSHAPPIENNPIRTDADVLSPRTSRLADFYELTKPRMNFLVLVTTAVGYYMAVRHSIDWLKLLHTLLGTAATAAAASALNQYYERHYDARMKRTAGRPLPAGRLAPSEALLFGVLLAIAGIGYLDFAVNSLTALLGALTLLSYVFIYTPLKRCTSLCTIVGAIPGAVPPVMGWTAVHATLSPETLALFAILFLWQIPHFLAIAILYRNDYAAAGFKMLPVIDTASGVTGRQIVVYTISLIPATLLPFALQMTGPIYLTLAILLNIAFLCFALSAATTQSRPDARRLFLASILYLPLLLAVMMIDKHQ